MANNMALYQRGIGDLQRSLERFETFNNAFILPDISVVIRLDARRYGDWGSYTDEYPCGPATTKAFLLTARALMSSLFRVRLAYVQGDEISLLLDPTETINPVRRSKIISAFSSTAAIHFMRATGFTTTFDATLSELPSSERVAEYIFWRRRCAYRNATMAALRKALHQSGQTPEQTEARLRGTNQEQQVSQLASFGVSPETIPPTTKWGSLLSWEKVETQGASHKKVHVETKLPNDDQSFERFLRDKVSKALGNYLIDQVSPTKPASELTREQQGEKNPKNSSPPHQKTHQQKKNRKAQVSVFKIAN